MSISIVQTSTANATASDNQTAETTSFSSPVTSNSTILVCVSGFLASGSSSSSYSVTDTAGNVYSLDLFVDAGVGFTTSAANDTTWVGIWRATNVAGGFTTITVTASVASTSWLNVVAMEVAGIVGINAESEENTVGGVTGESTGNFTTTVANCLCVAGISCASIGSFGLSGPSSPWTSISSVASGEFCGQCVYQIISTETIMNAGWTTTEAAQFAAVGVAYAAYVPPSPTTLVYHGLPVIYGGLPVIVA